MLLTLPFRWCFLYNSLAFKCLNEHFPQPTLFHVVISPKYFLPLPRSESNARYRTLVTGNVDFPQGLDIHHSAFQEGVLAPTWRPPREAGWNRVKSQRAHCIWIFSLQPRIGYLIICASASLSVKWKYSCYILWRLMWGPSESTRVKCSEWFLTVGAVGVYLPLTRSLWLLQANGVILRPNFFNILLLEGV